MTAVFDLDAAQYWLGEQGIALGHRVRSRRLGEGNSNLTYLLTTEGSLPDLVLRHPPRSDDGSARYVKREFDILTGLAATDVPVPSPVALCTDASVAGAPFLVMAHLAGAVMDSIDDARLLPLDARARVGPSLAERLAGIHALDPHQCGLDHIGPRTSYAERQINRWSPRWTAIGNATDQQVDEITRYLKLHMPPQAEHRIVHGDYSLGNVLLDPTGSVSGVLDWELCTLGDPLADLGTLLAYWPDEPGVHPATDDDLTLEPGFAGQADIVEAYAAQSGRDLADLGYFRVLAYWRLAIIIQGVHQRWLIDPRSASAAAGRLGMKAEKLIHLGHALMRDAMTG
ncbi:phosphotransferase family protein [Amycolatopsis panacis]|uniref:Phosphotransferase family protein n=1 Tax=Amycolatopsis panacis TaxID=2340917 RepID=A0A419I1T0_9PSEU|nr:phosphotransferase family protein [Amycolatopsis panacis]RJQ83676.1 phosphotransferase family protein [Amycolatopsis panacis]